MMIESNTSMDAAGIVRTFEAFSHSIEMPWESWEAAQKFIEKVARTCYKSEGNITGKSWQRMVKKLIDRGHEAMLEHASFSVLFSVDRGITHELVRHRVASFAQESTRYVNYDLRGFRFCDPTEGLMEEGKLSEEQRLQFLNRWFAHCARCAEEYNALLELGATPQMARLALPTGTMADIWVTANFREWRHILKLRDADEAHPMMRAEMHKLALELREAAPLLFSDVGRKRRAA